MCVSWYLSCAVAEGPAAHRAEGLVGDGAEQGRAIDGEGGDALAVVAVAGGKGVLVPTFWLLVSIRPWKSYV
jgi:hypothetical protein